MFTLRNTGIVYALSFGALVVYNVRWKYLKETLLGRKPRTLPVVKVKGDDNKCSIPIVLVHGMWHDASYFQRLQQLLKERGYTSYAISLLPGKRLLPGGSQKELVQDLEQTLQSLDRYILVGHSQGGLIVQSLLQNSKVIRENAVGAVLLGTFPLGRQAFSPRALRQAPTAMMTDLGFLHICAFGKLMNARYTKKIFLLPTTNTTNDDPVMQAYIQGLLEAPSDGLITTTHMLYGRAEPLDTPVLVLGASHDVIYPPVLLKQAFDERFPNATHVIAQDQAHCFVDPGWENSMAKPLMDWVDELTK